jgi:hypothetical protein
MKRATLERLANLYPSSRPAWAMMPTGVATHFTELLFFTLSALEHAGLNYVVHWGSLLGAVRLQGPLPWDDDHDVFLYGVDIDDVHRKLADVIIDHGYVLVRDPRGFFWVRDKHWPAASGHLALEFLPPLVPNPQDLPVWEGGAPHLLASELERTQDVPFYGSYIRAPAEVEPVLARLYGAAGTPAVMKAFTRPALHADMADFWAHARQPGQLDWPAISARAKRRSQWLPLLAVPWWWFNGAYIIAIGKIRSWARRKLSERAD